MTGLTTPALTAVVVWGLVVVLAVAAAVLAVRRAVRTDTTGVRIAAVAGAVVALVVLGGAARAAMVITEERPSNQALAAVARIGPPFRPVFEPAQPPDGFPEMRTTRADGMQPGTILIATSTTPRQTEDMDFHPWFLAEVDKASGDLVWAQRTYSMASMLQPESGGRFSYNVVDRNGRDGAGFHVTHRVTDDRLRVLDRYDLEDMPGGDADIHDFELLDNGNALLLAYRRRPVDLSEYGGAADATVYDPIVAERTPDGETVWLWDGKDHLDLDDVPPENVKLKLQQQRPPGVADYAHINSVEVFDDGDILISIRNMDCLHRIDRDSGDIVWTFGGSKCAQNEFDLSDDPYGGFSHQHDATLVGGDPDAGIHRILLFDNGNLRTGDEQVSRAVEYEIDENKKTAKMVWSHADGAYTGYFGSAERLDNGNTLISWGSRNDPVVTEVTPDGDRVFTLSLPPGQRTYRAYQTDDG